MAKPTIADLASFSKSACQVNERIALCLWNLEALVAVVLTTNDFFELSRSTMHSYFSVVADVISEMIALYQTNLTDSLHEE